MVGKFITIEGSEGSGKTTISKFLFEYITSLGIKVILTREPGGVPVSEKIRDIILHEDIDYRTEALLFAASRREHIVKKILPHLKQGYIVLCDRFVDSSLAYQVYGRGLEEKDVVSINDYATELTKPDKTFYLDVNVDKGLERIENRQHNNKMDNEHNEFYVKVKQGYDSIAAKNSDRVIKINANNDIELVKEEIVEKINLLLKKWNCL
ncbi:dTMP kinase [Gemella sp. GH3]|uniref:dTMP kinase n=1 Tax=unclassified Gemella TaxID=2624949 RepID=UPI0015D01FC7|nr:MULTISPECIES: dTMP kinase [unclassified Gemella]MBF0714454.1 dTMP kinase [Gemella sp. GH3.1]NYS51406.1 dTMP kinase [Gemella sp. GH3]